MADKKHLCDDQHPYIEGPKELPQCSATVGVYRCMQAEGHANEYHTTYGMTKEDSHVDYYWYS